MRKLLLILALAFLVTVPAWASFGTPTVTSASCITGSTCAITPAASGVGDVITLCIGTATQSITISSISGRATGALPNNAWYIPGGTGGVASNIFNISTTAGSLACGYVYSTTGGSGAITATLSGSATTPQIFTVEAPNTADPLWQGENPQALAQVSSSTITGASFHPVANSFCVQAIQAAQTVSSINTSTSGYAAATTSGNAAISYLGNTLTGNAPVWTLSSAGVAGVAGVCFIENAGVLSLNPGIGSTSQATNWLNQNWYASYRQGGDGLTCFTPGQIAITNGYLYDNYILNTSSCSSIDFAYASKLYQGGQISTRSTSFLYGSSGGTGNTLYCGTTCTIKAKVKFGGAANNGQHNTFFMFDVSCLNSFPTGTDGNCLSPSEIDVGESGLSSLATQVGQSLHAANGQTGYTTNGLTDTTTNFHVYEVDWSANSLLFKIDGVSSGAALTVDVPSTAMMLIFQIYSNGIGTIGGLPWQAQIDYISVTGTNGLIWQDDFMSTMP